VPPPRDPKAETREALKRFRDSIDLEESEDEITQTEVHVHVEVPSRPSSKPPGARKAGKVVGIIVATVGAIVGASEALRQLRGLFH
jgi:hypothetical protein